MKKAILITLGVLFLNGCVQNSAFLGPAIIGGSSGSVSKASLQYGAGLLIKKSTGKSTSEHAVSLIQEPIKIRKEKKIRNSLAKLLEQHILAARTSNLVQKHVFDTRKNYLRNN